MDIDLEAAQPVSNEIVAQGAEIIPSSTNNIPPPQKTTAERVAEQFGPSCAAITAAPSEFEITQGLSTAIKHHLCQRCWFVLLLSFIFLALGAVCFVILGQSSYSNAVDKICISFGIFFILVGCGWLIVSCSIGMQKTRPAKVLHGGIRYTIRIEGEQWTRYLSHFYSSEGRPSRARGWWFCYERGRERYQRLLRRGYGHIILGYLGFLADELFCTTYDRHIVLRVEPIPVMSNSNRDSGEPIVDMMLRIWMCRRVYDSRFPPTPFKVDIFLPPQIPSYELMGIIRAIWLR